MNLDPAVLKQISLIATGFSVAFLAALWLSLIFWALRDIRTRTRDPFMRVLAVVIVALLFLPGILIYLIIRPSKTLEEDYQHSLEEEALLQSIEDSAICPGCNRRVEKDWLACPSCHTRLKKTCEHCGKIIELPWNLCPYCTTPVAGMRKEAPVKPIILETPSKEKDIDEEIDEEIVEKEDHDGFQPFLDDEFQSHP